MLSKNSLRYFFSEPCPWCKGCGEISEDRIDGYNVDVRECWLCEGTGRVTLKRALWLILTRAGRAALEAEDR